MLSLFVCFLANRAQRQTSSQCSIKSLLNLIFILVGASSLLEYEAQTDHKEEMTTKLIICPGTWGSKHQLYICVVLNGDSLKNNQSVTI